MVTQHPGFLCHSIYLTSIAKAANTGTTISRLIQKLRFQMAGYVLQFLTGGFCGRRNCWAGAFIHSVETRFNYVL
jgi:hypothetical protein